jgi:hypothetical protein
MSKNVAIVVTTIRSPTPSLVEIAESASAAGWTLIVVGDRKTPKLFYLPGALYLDVDRQAASNWKLAADLGYDQYARKNLGYLEAISLNARCIVETDDDNYPKLSFFDPPNAEVSCRVARHRGWVNVYRLFSDANVWPRGFPLSQVRSVLPEPSGELETLYCPIQQGLADDDPDVDAIYRMVIGSPVVFENRPPVALPPGALCPINSQNTSWWPDAYPLLYLPSNCSFRMTDIWRGLIASRIIANERWNLLFRAATVRQTRNAHDLMDDFSQEIDGYLRVEEIAKILADTKLPSGANSVAEALMVCYEALCAKRVFPPQEVLLVSSWISDLELCKSRAKL